MRLKNLCLVLTTLALPLCVTVARAEEKVTLVHFNKAVNFKKLKIDRVQIMPVESTVGLDAPTAWEIQEAVNDVLQEWEVFTLPLSREEAMQKDDPFSFANVGSVAGRFQSACNASKAPFTLQVVAKAYRTESGRFHFTKGKSVVGLDFALCQKGRKDLIYRAFIQREAGKEATLKPGTGRKSRALALVSAILDGLGPVFVK